MNRPTGMADRRTANEARRVAAVRAALAARRAEQAAAARRRLVLTMALVVVSGVSWAAVALAQFSILLAAFPTVVLAAVLWLGVRTARAERAEWAQVPASLTQPRRSPVAGPTYSPSQLRSHLSTERATEASEAPAVGGLSWQTGEVPVEAAPVAVDADVTPAEIVADVETETVSEVVEAPGSWTPVPVPVPTYTLKPVAVRRESVVQSVESTTAEVAPAGDVSLEVSIDEGIDLRAVLARRRAVGA